MVMNHDMAQRLDDLFDAMTNDQVAAVKNKIVNTDADDIIGALIAMDVFEMGSTSGQSDPTTTSYMTKFGQLHTANGADQALVLKNADPLDAATMTKVIDAVSSLVGLRGVVEGSATDGALLLSAVGDFASKVDAIDSDATAADALVGVAGYGTAGSASSAPANITAQDASGAHTLLKAMNQAQLNEVLAHTRTLESTHLADLDSDVARLMGVPTDDVGSALTAFNALSSDRAELVFDTIENVGNLSDLGSGAFEAYVSGPVVNNIAASPLASGNANEVADADTSTDNSAGLSISVTFDEAMDQSKTPVLSLDAGDSSLDSLTLGSGSWNDNKTVFTQQYVVSDDGVDVEGITVTVSGARDAAGNPQLLQKAPVAVAPEAEFNIDTLNPDKNTITIDVADSAQTDAEAATRSFTVKTTDADPGTIHVQMRGTEYSELATIKGSYINAVNTAIGAGGDSPTGLRELYADGKALEDAVTTSSLMVTVERIRVPQIFGARSAQMAEANWSEEGSG